MENIRFGEMELNALFSLEEKGAGIVSFAQLRDEFKLSEISACKLASRLVRKKRLIRLKRGIYLFAPMKAGKEGHWSEDALTSIPLLMKEKEYYVSFWMALNHYGLTEQIPYTIQILTTRHQRSFDALQTHYELVQTNKLGEWREEKIGDKTVRMATIEQLLIDCMAKPRYCGGIKVVAQAVWEARKRIDWDKMDSLVSKSKDSVQRRYGYLCDLLKVHKFKPQKPIGWRWLDPSRGKKEKITESKKWGLIVNVSDKTLTEWMES